MKLKTKVMLVLGVMVCFGLALSAPVTFAAEKAPAKAATMAKPMAKKEVKTAKKAMAKKEIKTTKKAMAAKKTMHKPMVKANAEVRAAQKALIKDGAKIKADGLMGRHTRAAIKAFQKKNHLKVTGRLDKETMAKL